MKKQISLVITMVVMTAAVVFNLGITEAGQGGLSEKEIQTYLEKTAVGESGSCLVHTMSLEIVGISDVVPGHQIEVFYSYEYQLRCNQGRKSDKGKGVLRAARLRNGSWIDRKTFAIIGN